MTKIVSKYLVNDGLDKISMTDQTTSICSAHNFGTLSILKRSRLVSQMVPFLFEYSPKWVGILNKTKDWALVQNAALTSVVVNLGLVV